MGACITTIYSVRNSNSLVDSNPIKANESIQSFATAVSEPTATESAIYRHPGAKSGAYEEMFSRLYNGTLLAELNTAVKQHPGKDAVAWRPIERFEKAEIEENGKKKMWEFIHLCPTKTMSYGDTWSTMEAFGRGLRQLGLQKGANIGIYEETRMEWIVSCYGIWMAGCVGVTVYANLGEDALEYAIKEAQLSAVICNSKGVSTIQRLYERCKLAVPLIIYTDAEPSNVGSTVHSWEHVVSTGRGQNDTLSSPQPQDRALIMYTSGTTGDPKGVDMTHGNCHAAVKMLGTKLLEYIDVSAKDNTYLAYLPLAHILEFAAENVMLQQGTMLCYGNPRTLTDVSARPHGDLKEFKPVLLAGVPRVFDSIKKVVEGRITDGIKKQVFQRAYNERLNALRQGKDTPFYNNSVFGVPRALLGGRVRAIISGGAPLSAKTQEFMYVVFGCSVGQGYGLTETMACCSIQNYWDIKPECLGGPLDGVEVKLRDVDEWKHTDNPPRGEICIRGPVITQGYYKQPDKTAEAFDKVSGWFATGDVGMIDERGRLRIVGRVKALAKNAFGEYIALDALEAVYILNPLVMPNGVCVLVDSQKAYICALVLTDEAKAMKFAADNNIAGTWPAILDNNEFQQKAAASLAATAKANGKKPFECVRSVRVLNDEWTPENGVLTAAMKLKRRIVDQKYAAIIKELFAAE